MASLLSQLTEPQIEQGNSSVVPCNNAKLRIQKEASWQRPDQYHDFKGFCIDFVISSEFYVQDWVVGHDYVHFQHDNPPISIPARPIKIHHHVLNHPQRNSRTVLREIKGICKAIAGQLKLLTHEWYVPEPYGSKMIVEAAKDTLKIIYSSSQSERHDSFTIKADLMRLFFRFNPPVHDPHMVPATDESIMELEHKVISTADLTEKNCAVCLDELRAGCEAVSMPCSHMFHENCIVGWLKTSHYCPLCRFKMPTDQI